MSWGYVAVGAGMVVSSIISSESSDDAVDAQVGAANAANEASMTAEQRARKDNEPWRLAGQESLNKLMGLMNDGTLTSRFAGKGVETEPGYAFGMQQGMRAVDNSASARGGIGGAALKAGARYAQDYAGTKYGQAFDRDRMEKSDLFNRLSGIAGTGQQINAANSAVGMQVAGNVGNNLIGAGNAQAANALNQGNIYGNAFNQLGAYGSRNWGSSGGGGYGAGYAGATDYGQYGVGSGGYVVDGY